MALILLVCKLARGSALCFILHGNYIPHLRERLTWGKKKISGANDCAQLFGRLVRALLPVFRLSGRGAKRCPREMQTQRRTQKARAVWEHIPPKGAAVTDKCCAPSLCHVEQKWAQPSVPLLFWTGGLCCGRVSEPHKHFLSLTAVTSQCLLNMTKGFVQLLWMDYLPPQTTRPHQGLLCLTCATASLCVPVPALVTRCRTETAIIKMRCKGNV